MKWNEWVIEDVFIASNSAHQIIIAVDYKENCFSLHDGFNILVFLYHSIQEFSTFPRATVTFHIVRGMKKTTSFFDYVAILINN